MEKMSKVLLTSKTAWSSRLCALTWKEKDTKSGRSIFQLQVSALPTEEKESGLWLTPSASVIANRSKKAMEHRIKYRKSIGRTTVPPGSLAEQVQYGKPTTDMMWPTPRACDLEGGVVKNVELKNKSFSRVNKKGVRFGVKLKDAVHKVAQMWPTPREFMYKDSKIDRGKSNLGEVVGGTLNPTWVEWLMGYPAGYTDLKDWEILSSRKLRKKSATQSSKRRD